MDAGLDGDQELTAVQEAPGSRPARRDPAGVRAASFLHRSPGVRLAALLAAPMVWLVVAYLGSLAVMFAAAFWSTDSFTGALIKQASWDNFRTLVEEPVYRRIALRTLGVAATVTVVDALIALPIALYMAKVARPRARRLLVAAILTPLWASYLVKAYAWRILLSSDGAGGLGAGTAAPVRSRVRAGRGDADAGVPVAAVHDPAGVRRAGPGAGLAAGGLRRPRRAGRTDVPVGGAAADLPGAGGRARSSRSR